MHVLKSIKIIIIIYLLISCEDVGIIEETPPFEKLIVVNGQLTQNSTLPIISITKSAPLKSTNQNDFYLENVTAYIRINELKIYPLEYIGNGNYSPTSTIEIDADYYCEFFCDIDGEKIYAETIIPRIPTLHKVDINEGVIQIQIKPQENVVYSAQYFYSNYNATIYEEDFSTVFGPSEDINNNLILTTSKISDSVLTDPNVSIGVMVFAWDESFKAYYKTKDKNKAIDDIFSEGGGLVNWNIEADNAIGMFIGYSTKSIGNLDK